VIQRFQDFLRERRIRSLSNRTKALMAVGRSDEARILWAQATLEIRSRSPQQIERMERAAGLYGEGQ